MNFLDTILRDTRLAVAQRKSLVPLAALEQRPAFSAPTLPFGAAIRQPDPSGGPAIIAELKRASPSAGMLRSEYQPVEIARQYKASGAAALSVVTEPLHFKGSLEDLGAVRLVSDLPVLRKDFVVDAYQLFEARAFGADAVLLIAAALDRFQLRDLHDAATALGLTPLVELHQESELDRLDLDQVLVVGVNNRDLTTFEVDLRRAPRILAHVPEGVVRVAESGLRTAASVAEVHRAGIDAVLIGETFMRASNAGAALRRLRGDVTRLSQMSLRLAS